MVRLKCVSTLIIMGIVILCMQCKSPTTESRISEEHDTSSLIEETVKKAKNIFYRMYLPSEMYKVFEKAGAVYNPEILNPVENVNLYETSFKTATNLGIYGVDLSYNKMFGQNQKTLLYFTVIHKLSQQLGIPDNQFAIALRRMEKNISNRDSLAKYATDLFVSANKFLNENERESTAALILAGGWVEALYIASKISDENVDNQEIIERIAFQKYSLQSLVSILSNYGADENVNRYLLMFKALNKTFDRFEIYYQQGDLSIDTVNKLINAKKIDFNIQSKDIKEIKALISQIRADMVK